MAFSQKVATLLAYRSGYICNNPECNVLTIGPASSDPHLRTKKGEAAHIIGEKKGAARYQIMEKAYIESDQNGIWLCVACHTLVDKNNGIDYDAATLSAWKRSHEELMSVLLKTHRSPLPLIQRFSSNAKVAQEIVDTLALKGVLHESHGRENPEFTIRSIDRIRHKLMRLLSKIDFDSRLRDICEGLIAACREVMNENTNDIRLLNSYIDVFRKKVGKRLYQLEKDYDCKIAGQAAWIVGP